VAKVLLVEDDNNLREIFAMRLKSEGYEVSVAGDGEEALATAVKEKPDLIVADIMMPRLSGFEMLENLRAAPAMAKTKVIMMTALGQAEDRTRGEQLGVVKYLVKSQVTLEDFVRVVREVMSPATNNQSSPNQRSDQMDDDKTKSTNPTDAPAPGASPMPAGDSGSAMPSGDSGGSSMPAGDAQSTKDEKADVDSQISGAMGAMPSGDSGGSTPSPVPDEPKPDEQPSPTPPPTSPEPDAGSAGSHPPAAGSTVDPNNVAL